MAERIEDPANQPLTADELVDIPGDKQADFDKTRARNYGRWRFDDWLMDSFVRIANRPRWLVLATFAVLIGAGLTYAVIEDKGPIEGIWWSIVTGFTVGYGDQYPVTTAGRGLGAALIISMFILALCLGAQITARLIEDQDEFTHSEQERMKQQVAKLIATQERILDILESQAPPASGGKPRTVKKSTPTDGEKDV